MKLNEYNTIYNLYVNRYSSNKCRKIVFLKENTFFSLFTNTPVSIILNILKLCLLDKKNGKEIYNSILQKYPNFSIIQQHILEILDKARYIIAHYIKDQYAIENISEQGKNECFAIDESIFINVGNRQLWIVRIINTKTKKISLEVTFVGKTEFMKKFIYNYIKIGNCIVSDQWGAYDWTDEYDNHNHSVHNHGYGDFGMGNESTSHIESVWGNLKNLIKNFYYSIPSTNFILFLREAEFRHSIASFSASNKWKVFTEVLNYAANIGIKNLYSLDYLSEFTELLN